jgi:hypothetical protein
VFRHRAREQELTDAPDCDAQLARESYEFMKLANRRGGGTRLVLDFLERELAGASQGRTWRLLDLGAGCCDIPLAVARWARRRGHDVEITCVDHNTHILELARGVLGDADGESITLQRADIFAYQPKESFDYAFASMVLHHFTAEEIRAVVAHVSRFVRRALVINDLRRSALNYLACYVNAHGRDPRVRHDALLSVRRGFTRRDLSDILRDTETSFSVRNAWFCRVAGIVRFDDKGTP